MSYPCISYLEAPFLSLRQTSIHPSKGPMHVLLYSVPPTLQQAPTDPCLCRRLPNIRRQVWVSPLWDHCFFLLGPGAQGSVVPSESLFPESISQSRVSSGSSMVGLMVTSSKRAYAIPKTAAPRASVPVAYHHQPAPPQETLKHSSLSVSVGPLHPCALKVCLSPLSISGRNGV